MNLAIIMARAYNGVIGTDDNKLPFRIPEDLAHFKAVTMGYPIVMGRTTWDSLPRKPLPGRPNFVLTRDPQWSEPGAIPIHSLEELSREDGPVWVIGGAQVYALALTLAVQASVTEVDIVAVGSVKAPQFGKDWHRAEVGAWRTSTSGLRFRYTTLYRA